MNEGKMMRTDQVESAVIMTRASQPQQQQEQRNNIP